MLIKRLFLAEAEWMPIVTNLWFERIDLVEAEVLEAPFTEDEVFKVLCSFRGIRRRARMNFQWQFGIFLGIL